MRLFIIFIFLTFVWIQNVNAAPQSSTVKSSPIDDKNLVNQDADDYYPPAAKQNFKMQFGGISGKFNDNDAKSWHYMIGLARKSEFDFERYFYWGLSLVSNESAEVKIQADLNSLFMIDPLWRDFGIGVSQFMWGENGISNLVNINQTKFVIYADVATYFQIQAYTGLQGIAYSISFQSWF